MWILLTLLHLVLGLIGGVLLEIRTNKKVYGFKAVAWDSVGFIVVLTLAGYLTILIYFVVFLYDKIKPYITPYLPDGKYIWKEDTD